MSVTRQMQQDDDQNTKSSQEIHMIDKSVTKVAYLLVIGYGEAGTGLIIKSMKQKKGTSVDVPGEKIIGIYGFCDIRNFTDATEVLQPKVMQFVNRIAAVVHTNVVKFGGIPNKNIGDAFLFAWKLASFSEEPAFAHRLQNHLDGDKNALTKEEVMAMSMIVDLSVYSIIKIIAKTNSYKQLLSYREHKGLNERIPDYQIKLGYGLHIGWSIEGLIGSPHKVDASYLSPHVNIAAQLEGGTKMYGASWLLSEKVFDFLSMSYKAICRHIDVCMIMGCPYPMRIYTIETQVDNLPKQKDRFLKLNVKARQKIVSDEKNILFDKLVNEDFDTCLLLERDKEVRRMLHFNKLSSTEPFNKAFDKALKHYLKGSWVKAQKYFAKCLVMKPNDGPCLSIQKFMTSAKLDPTAVNYQGHRDLVE